jgi:hypothetical protein
MGIFGFRHLGPLGALGVVVLGGASGCQSVTNTTAVQCTSEAECLSLGPDFAGTTCDPQTKTCIRVQTDQDLCTTNQQCSDRNRVPSICRKSDRKCVELITPECPLVIQQPGQLLNDNAVIAGLIIPAGATFDGGIGDAMEKSVQLAQKDMSKQAGGLPAIDGTSNARPFVLLSCHEFQVDGYAGVLRMANHLVNDVGVSVVVGPVDMAHATSLDNQVFIPKTVLNILPTGQISTLGTLPSAVSPTPLVWSLLYTEQSIATQVSELVTKQLEPKLRAEGVAGPIKVAVLIDDNFLGQTTTDAVEKKLVFNGVSAIENGQASPSRYLRLNDGDIQDYVGNPAPETRIAKSIAEIYDFKPNIVLHAYPPGAIAATFFPLVLNWPPGLPPAFHVDLIGTFPAFGALNDIIGLTGLTGRVFTHANHVAGDKAKVDQWVIKFKSEFPDLRDSPLPNQQIVQSWYDATYMAAYAVAANGQKPLTGGNLAQTLPRLVPAGQQIFVGPEDLGTGFGLLNGGQGIDLQGLTGSMDLDLKSASINYDLEELCPDVADGKVVGWKPAGFFTQNGVGTGNLDACK